MKNLKRFVSFFLITVLVFTSLAITHAEQTGDYILLQPGDKGEAVLKLQERLNTLGYITEESDGFYGPGTEAAVSDFQRANNLLVTGIADQTTQALLFSEKANSYFQFYEDVADFDEEYSLLVQEAAGANSFALPAATSMPFALKGAHASAPALSFNRDSYAFIRENGFQSVSASLFSTFAADIDTSSYAQVRSRILRGESVPIDSIRTEEILNYFRYTQSEPKDGEPFAVTMELTDCPWNDKTKLLRVLLSARKIPDGQREPRHLIFLIDTSGSMDGKDRLDLVKRAFLMLLENMDAKDYVSIVTYASREETLIEYMPAAEKTRIMEAITDLEANGYTNGSAGLIRAYEIADKYASEGQNTRILLATDGDLNVGVTSEGDLARLVMDKKQNGTTLTVLGFGYGNYQDDRLQALANYGDGNCYFIDTIYEARKALVTESGSTFDLVASDVKIQLDFNPGKIRGYRLIGYENKMLAAEDFADDTKDGGDIGSGQQMTALYEIVPADSDFDFGGTESKYTLPSPPSNSAEWLTLNLRAKVPGQSESQLYSYPLIRFASAELSNDMKFAAAIAETSMCLRDSEYKGTSSYTGALDLLRSSEPSGDPYKEEFVYLVTLLERASDSN